MPDIKTYHDTNRVLALCRYGSVTPRLFEALLQTFGSLKAVMSANMEELIKIDGIDREQAIQIVLAVDYLEDANKFEKGLNDRDITLCSRVDQDYPVILQELNNPPPLLYIKGSLPKPDKKIVTVVGVQRATSEGISLTSTLVKKLIKANVQIVSSLTGGVDTAVHLACNSNGGVSFAILQGGMDHLSGEGMLQLGNDISEKGGIISEESPEIDGNDVSMTQSNRLLAGMSQAVIITESNNESKRVEDIICLCRDIGKLLFFYINPEHGVLADEESLSIALECGAIPIEGPKRISDIVKSLI